MQTPSPGCRPLSQDADTPDANPLLQRQTLSPRSRSPTHRYRSPTLDADPPGYRPPPPRCRSPGCRPPHWMQTPPHWMQTLWMQTPWSCDHDVCWEANPSLWRLVMWHVMHARMLTPCTLWIKWQTHVKTLPYLKLRLLAVIIDNRITDEMPKLM